jgi:hypothetical protein
METKRKLRQFAELGVGLTAIATLILAGCGGGSGGTTASATGSTTIAVTPFKGIFASGSKVNFRDANGNLIQLLNGSGTINASGVASVTFPSNVNFPLVIEVAGTYWNEATGAPESSVMPIRAFIPDMAAAGAASGVGVSFITEMAVSALEHKLGSFSAASAINAASAVVEIDGAASIIGRDHFTLLPPVFNASGITSDPDTLKLAALAIVANNKGAGPTLADKLRDLARIFALNQASAPTAIISQAEMDAALAAINGGASSIAPPGPRPQVNCPIPLAPVGWKAVGAKAKVIAAASDFLSTLTTGGGLYHVSPAGSALMGAPASAVPAIPNGYTLAGNGIAAASGVITTPGAVVPATARIINASLNSGTYTATLTAKEYLANGTWGAPTATPPTGNDYGYYLTSGGWVHDTDPSTVTLVNNGDGTINISDPSNGGDYKAYITETVLDGMPVLSCADLNNPATCILPLNRSFYPAGSLEYTGHGLTATTQDKYYVANFLGTGPEDSATGAKFTSVAALAGAESFCTHNRSVLWTNNHTATATNSTNYTLQAAVPATLGCGADTLFTGSLTASLTQVTMGNETVLVASKVAIATVNCAKFAPCGPALPPGLKRIGNGELMSYIKGGWWHGWFTPAGTILQQVLKGMNKTAMNANLKTLGAPALP